MEVPAPELRICFVGDSYTAGVGDVEALGWVGRVVSGARRGGAELTAYNLGVRRDTLPQMQQRLEVEARPRLRDGDAHAVVLAGGINDTAEEDGPQRVPRSASLKALTQIADQARSAGWSLLVIGPAPVTEEQHARRIVELSRAMEEHCRLLDLPYVELAASLDDDHWRAEVATLDGAHPTAAGYERLSRLIAPPFLAWLRTLHP